MITILHRGGYGQKITILHREGGSTETPKMYYVIYERPLITNMPFHICQISKREIGLSCRFWA